MSIPFTVDVSDFYGEPDPTEQSSNTIIDRRKTISLHKKINGKNNTVETNSPAPKKRGRKSKKQSEEVAVNNDPVAYGNAGTKGSLGGAIKIGNSAGALAFNEAQLMNELTGLKKGGALPALAAAVIPTLIEMAPQIISAVKSMKKGVTGGNFPAQSAGAIKVGGASAVFLDGVDPSKYDDMIKTMKAIERQRKNIIREGGAIKVGSGKMGTFFKNAWSNIKSWYGNNAEKLKPITDILVNSAVNSANKMIDKGVNYVANKTGSDTVRQIGDVVGNMAKNTVGNTAAAVKNYGQTGSGYDVGNIDNTIVPETVTTKKKKILTAMPNNERTTVASQVRCKKSRSVYG